MRPRTPHPAVGPRTTHPDGSALVALCAAALVALPGCVVVEQGKKRPSDSGSLAASRTQSNTPLPSGPVARPAADARVSSSLVRVNVSPLGVVQYDGQCLPLISPDGRFLAVQEGDPPSWPTLLAEPGAQPAASTRLAAYNLTTSPATRLEWPGSPPEGLVLGRAADETGVLVELPREDGSRWIGKLFWLSGEVTWLVQGPDVNAHAFWTADERLLFTRRAVDEPSSRARLVLRNADASESVRASMNGGCSFPLATSDTALVYALVRTPNSTDLEAVRVLADNPSAPAKLGGVVGRRVLSRSADPAMPYQIAAPIQGPAPIRRAQPEALFVPPTRPDPLVIFHPQFARMAVFDVRQSSFGLLAANSMGAVRIPAGGADGYFCATPDGLVFSAMPDINPGKDDRRPPDVRVLAGMYAPRATTDAARPYLLLAPSRQDPTGLQVMGMTLASAPPQ